MGKKIQVSVITVAYQAAGSIDRTIRSVYGQDFGLYEYILIDGGSSDGTYETICSYDGMFSDKGIPYIHISGPDSGIYDAMNKGLEYCSGEWVYYLGAGDELYGPDTLKKIFSNSFGEGTAFIYGDVWRKKDGIKFFRPADDMGMIRYTLPFCHQAVFVKRDLMREYRFDCRYTVAADYELFVRLYMAGAKYEKVDQPVAVFDLGGVSQKQINLIIKENRQIWEEAGFLKEDRIKHFIRGRVILPLKKSRLAYMAYMAVMRTVYGKSGR